MRRRSEEELRGGEVLDNLHGSAVILDPRYYDPWLDTRTTDPAVVSVFLKPFDARLMNCFPVSSRVNRPANDDAECSAPVEITQPQGSLF
jgi:putative SOS response-associated peptidase YedK